MNRIIRSTDIKGALRSRQRGFILNPYAYGAGGPVVASRVSSVFTGSPTTSGTSLVCNMPASIQPGDRLVAIACMRGNRTLTAGAAAGWTRSTQQTFGSGVSLYILDKVAVGGDTLTITWNSGNAIACEVIRITNGNNLQYAFAATSSNSPNPPLLTPSGGAKPYLWLMGNVHNNATASVTGPPAGYTQRTNGTGGPGTVGSIKLFSFQKDTQLSVTSDDPPAYTASSSSVWIAFNIALWA